MEDIQYNSDGCIPRWKPNCYCKKVWMYRVASSTHELGYQFLSTGMLRMRLLPCGGAIMALAMHPSDKFEVAVGSEDGCVRFVSIDPQFTELNPRLGLLRLPSDPSHYSVTRSNRSDGMCLSLAWKPYQESADGIVVCGDSTGRLRWLAGSSKKVMGQGTMPSS
eukprot:IDg11717t1